MNRRDFEEAIRREVGNWPGVTVEFADGSKHPKAKFAFTPEGGEQLIVSRPFAGTQSDASFGIHAMLGDMRRAMKSLGASRSKPEPSKDEDEAPYRKPNEGAAKRPDPVRREPAPIKDDLADKLVGAGAATAEQAEIARASRDPESGRPLERDGRPILVNAQSVPSALPTLLARLLACGIEIVTVGPVGVASVIAEAADLIEDGIYFGLPDEVYHAVPRLSASGIQKLCVSPATFWRGSWLDPDRPELDEEATDAQILGKAYHCARLEPERFHASYVRKISKADFPAEGLLTSDAAVKAELKNRGLVQSIGNESIAERAQRLADDGYEGTILPLETAKWETEVKGRIPLPADHFDQIVTDMERIRGCGEIAELLSDGEPEVSVFWTDQHGIRMKSRLDWLKVASWSDLKTFDNSRGNELGQALANAVRYNRLHVQAVIYRDATEAIRTGDIPIKSEATDAQRALIEAIRNRADPLSCWFIFQEKGGVPNLLGREFRFSTAGTYRDTEIDTMVDEDEREAVRSKMAMRTMLCLRAIWEIDRAKRAFVLHCEVYEPGQPWFPIEPLGAFDDIDFNTYWLEGRAGS